MNFAEAAEIILREAGEPLHFRDITQQAIDLGLIDVQGQTPWNSMNGVLRRTIHNRGAASAFVSLGDGRFALRAWGLMLPQVETPSLWKRLTGAFARPKPPAKVLAEGPEAPQGVPGVITVRERPIVVSPTMSRRNAVEITEESALNQAFVAGWKWHGVLPAGWTWQSVPEQAGGLLAREPEHPYFVQIYTALRGMLAWGLCSVLSSLALLFGKQGPFLAGLATQWLLWGSANTVVAINGLDNVLRQDAAVSAGQVTRKTMDARSAWYTQLFALGTGLGLGTLLIGLVLRNAGGRDSRTRGAGVGLITQGTFLLTLATLTARIVGIRWNKGRR
ncbi:MAG: winged helix-turn-helix domain-containing protein [Anaerolineae bacterium]